MHNITLICTRHEECGNCNSFELLRLIESVSPDIIFEELSFSNFHRSYTEGSLITLETKAIKWYLENHNINHIPVDTFDLPHSYHDQVDCMYKRISENKTIKEVRDRLNLVDQLEILLARHGFAFLNSKQNNLIFDKLDFFKHAILSTMNDENLFRISKLEIGAIEKREAEILENVYQYSRENAYKQALMFIGSGHRQSIMKKIEEAGRIKKIKLNWSHYNDLIPEGMG